MPKYYLRMEGVNQSNFVYEIQDLNTVRGGGLILLDAVNDVAAHFGLHDAISTGASMGLFACDLEKADAFKLRDEVQRFLNTNYRYRHATFVVDVAKAVDDFDSDRERLLALNRWRQMSAPQVAVPKHNDDLDVGICAFDLIRPATVYLRSKKSEPATQNNVGEAVKPRNASASVKTRNIYGRNKKRRFLVEQVGAAAVAHPSPIDLGDICASAAAGNLHHKMAVIYIDGNGFGKIQQKHCRDQQSQIDFDNQVKDYRRGWLSALIERMNTDNAWRSSLGNYRLEILQWGGDETCWVVPAWKGWELLSLLYQISREGDWNFRGSPLTHAAGMIFCHYNAPIQRIKDLAHDLSELAKEKGRDSDLFAYQILESFDHIGRDNLKAYRLGQTPQPDDPTQLPDASKLILAGKTMPETRALMAQIKMVMPRRKLTEIVHGLLLDVKAAERERVRAATNKLIASTMNELKSEEENLQKLMPQLGGERAWWVHLNALWDYV